MTDGNISNLEMQSKETSREDFMDAFDEPQVAPPDERSTPSTESLKTEKVFEIDEKFKDLPPEEGFKRTVQSRYDKLLEEHTKLKIGYDNRSKYEGFLNELLEDDEVLEAFLTERKPELIQKRDITEQIQEKLKSEFGEEFKPTRTEADENPGGKDWLYFKRLDELYTELKGGKKGAKTIKELRAERDLSKKREQEQLDTQVQELKTEMNWDDQTVERFYDWSQKLSMKDLGKIFRWAMSNPKRSPSLQSAPGDPTQPSARANFLSSL